MNNKWNHIHLLPIITIIIGLVATLLSSIIAEKFMEFFGLLLTVVFASLFVGIFLGFLFGIPKLNKKFNPSVDYEQKRKYMPNTNLEDISDWLTKIIVGVSLTHATKVPNYLENIAHSILSKNKCTFNCDYAQPIIIALIIFFLISGFIIGYFYTRLYLPNLLSIMEENEQQNEKIKIWEEGYIKTFKPSKVDIIEETEVPKSKLASLSVPETNILKMIFSDNNNYTVQRELDTSETAAISVLITKGFIVVAQGGTSGYSGYSGYSGTSGHFGSSGYSSYFGTTLRIVDKVLLNELKS